MSGVTGKIINEYYTIPSSVIEKIREMKIEGKSTEDIEAKVSRESKLNPENGRLYPDQGSSCLN